MRKIVFILAGFLTYSILHLLILNSYENTKAHTKFNEVFVEFFENLFKSSYKEGDELWIDLSNSLNKVTGPGVTNPGFFESTYGESDLYLTPKEWIAHGGFSADEPEVPAATRHFYDPLGLRDGKKYLTNRGTYWEGLYPNPGTDAIEWALGDTPNGSANKWSAKQGKEYFLLALKEPDPTKKRRYMAMAWRCLGEVLHNTADMVCPAHVRNDSHAAPLGLSWGWAFGSPDAYEEMFNPNWVATFDKSEPDPNLKTKILNAKTIREVNEALAKFTNENFFSNETISGYGVKEIKPANGEKAYPLPKLDKLEYVETEYTYYKTFPSGRRIKMCKDKSYFRFRGYPYIDKECVMSQATELIPNFVFAALKIFALYLPPVYLQIDSMDVVEGKVFGSVKFADQNKPEEYPDLSSATYNGEVIVLVDGKSFKAECKDGVFEASVDKSLLQNSKKIKAYIDMYGVQFSSPILDNSLPKFKELKQLVLGLEFLEPSSGDEKGYSVLIYFKPITSFENNVLIVTNTEKDSEKDLFQFVRIQFSPTLVNGSYCIEKINVVQKYSYFTQLYGYRIGDEEDFNLELEDFRKSLVLTKQSYSSWITLNSEQLRNTIKICTLLTKEHKLKFDNNSNPIGVETETKNYSLSDIIWSAPSLTFHVSFSLE